MSSLFTRKRIYGPDLLTLPALCVPGPESEQLRAKREAQLKWMHDKGVRYLAAPMTAGEREAAVEARNERTKAAVKTLRAKSAPVVPPMHGLAANG